MRSRRKAGSGPSSQAPQLIRASELGEYAFCARAWWYRHVVKLEPPEGAGRGRLLEGQRAHALHGRGVERARLLRAASLALAALGAMLLLVGLFLSALG